jgi:REP element-mobilizing transposase RayT
MPNTYTNLLFHIVYSTKYRKPLIKPEWQDDLYGYIGGIIREEKGILLTAGGMSDHIHLLAKLPPTIAVSDMLRLIKADSSKWLNERDDVGGTFEWQTGYAAFSVSESQVPRVRGYIQTQEEHHRRQAFKDEYLGLLRKHHIEFDERYVFDEEHIG